MGVLEIAVAALVVMGAITGGSAITGAVLGSRFLWGLFLPVVGIGRVWISDRLTQKSDNANMRTADRTAETAARKQFAIDNPRKQRRIAADNGVRKSSNQSVKQQRSKDRRI